MKHPIVNGKFQYFIEKYSLFQLIIWYLLFTILFSLTVSFFWNVFTYSVGVDFFKPLLLKLWYSFVFLYGYQPELSQKVEGLRYMSTILSVSALIFPTILLGTIVFKIFMPKNNRVVFKETAVMHSKNKDPFIGVYCYLGSKLNFINWDFKAYIRIYLKNKKEEFPLRTYPIKVIDENFPLPYSLLPTQIRMPFYSEEDKIEDETIPVFEISDQQFVLKGIGNDVFSEQIDEFELIIVTSAQIPKLDTEFVETMCYHSSQILFDHCYKIKTTFDLKNKKGTVHNWDAF